MLLGELHDPVLHGVTAATVERHSFEVADARLRPELDHRGALFPLGKVHRHLQVELLALVHAADLDGADAGLLVRAEDGERLAVDERRVVRGRELAHVDAAERHADFGDARRSSASELRDHLVVDALAGMDHLDRSAGLFGEAHEERVAHVGPDAERIDARGDALGEKLLLDLVLVADLAVGEEHDDAAGRQAHGLDERLEHLGPATRIDRLDPAIGGAQRRGREGGHRGRHHVDGVVEGDHGEAVAFTELPQAEPERRLCLGDRRAAH